MLTLTEALRNGWTLVECGYELNVARVTRERNGRREFALCLQDKARVA
jgi:hypothetical protein